MHVLCAGAFSGISRADGNRFVCCLQRAAVARLHGSRRRLKQICTETKIFSFAPVSSLCNLIVENFIWLQPSPGWFPLAAALFGPSSVPCQHCGGRPPWGRLARLDAAGFGRATHGGPVTGRPRPPMRPAAPAACPSGARPPASGVHGPAEAWHTRDGFCAHVRVPETPLAPRVWSPQGPFVPDAVERKSRKEWVTWATRWGHLPTPESS